MVNGLPLTTVDSYKYLGNMLTSDLDSDAQWEHLNKKVGRSLFLLRTMRNLGFKQTVLTSVYKSLVLSLITRDAPTLCSCSERAKAEMTKVQEHALKIISMHPEAASIQYNIMEVADLIHLHCIKVFGRIISNPNHALTTRLARREVGRTRNSFPIVLSRCHSTRYQQSFVQRFLRVFETDITSLPS